jgi:hypothetical protein
MTPVGPAAAWENELRPWRLASALFSIAQLPAMVAVFLVVFVFDERYKEWAYVAGGVIVLFELAQWAIAREALRRNPNMTRRLRDLYSSLPLNRRQRQLVAFNLALSAIGPALLITVLPTGSLTARSSLPRC